MSMVIDFMFRENILQEMLDPQTKRKESIYLIINYMLSLLCNALLTSLYVVQVFSEHADCITPTGINILHDIKLAYQIGLYVVYVDVFSNNIISVYIKYKASEKLKAKYSTEVIEWFVRLITLGATAI